MFPTRRWQLGATTMQDLRGYPNLTEAARLLAVSLASLSRQQVDGVPMGGKEIRLPPREVLRLADFFKRRPVSDVAGELVERAFAVDETVGQAVLDEVDAVLSARPSLRPSTGTDFLAEARRVLPRRLYAQVAKYYRASVTPPAGLGPAGPIEEGSHPAPAPEGSASLGKTSGLASDRASADTGVLVPRA